MKTNKSSSTAKLICLGIEVCRYDKIFKQITSDKLVKNNQFLLQLSPKLKFFSYLMKSALFRFVFLNFEKLYIPGLSKHYVLRKMALRKLVWSSLEKGDFDQLIVLGAGHDMLAKEVMEDFNLPTIEIDYQSTSELKSLQYQLMKQATPVQIQCDLVKKNPNEIDLSRKSLIVAEGLFMYLPINRVQELTSFLLNSQTKSKNELIFSYMKKDKHNRVGFNSNKSLVDLWLSLKSERFSWGWNEQQSHEFLASNQYTLLNRFDAQNLKQDFNLKHTQAEGEIYLHIKREDK